MVPIQVSKAGSWSDTRSLLLNPALGKTCFQVESGVGVGGGKAEKRGMHSTFTPLSRSLAPLPLRGSNTVSALEKKCWQAVNLQSLGGVISPPWRTFSTADSARPAILSVAHSRDCSYPAPGILPNPFQEGAPVGVGMGEGRWVIILRFLVNSGQ